MDFDSWIGSISPIGAFQVGRQVLRSVDGSVAHRLHDVHISRGDLAVALEALFGSVKRALRCSRLSH
jgi:hypothetical protein